MQIVFHIGAHCTDDERLLKTLLNNNEVFAAEGIAVPGPGKYRNLLRDTMQNLKGQVPAPNTRDILLDAILDDAPAERMVLIGDSAHGIHPIAGQGLNLGLRDVAALTEVLVDGMRLGLCFGDAQLLDRYGRWRSIDTLLIAVSTDGLNRLFSFPGKTASAVRRFGMAMVQRAAPAKAFFMAEARGKAERCPNCFKVLRFKTD